MIAVGVRAEVAERAIDDDPQPVPEEQSLRTLLNDMRRREWVRGAELPAPPEEERKTTYLVAFGWSFLPTRLVREYSDKDTAVTVAEELARYTESAANVFERMQCTGATRLMMTVEGDWQFETDDDGDE